MLIQILSATLKAGVEAGIPHGLAKEGILEAFGRLIDEDERFDVCFRVRPVSETVALNVLENGLYSKSWIPSAVLGYYPLPVVFYSY